MSLAPVGRSKQQELDIEHLSPSRFIIFQHESNDKMPRPKQRLLVRWNDDLDKSLLLFVAHTCQDQGIRIPYDEVARKMGSPFTEGAIVQHITRLRTKMLDAGIEAPVPPAPRRGAVTSKPSMLYKKFRVRSPSPPRLPNLEDHTSSVHGARTGVRIKIEPGLDDDSPRMPVATKAGNKRRRGRDGASDEHEEHEDSTDGEYGHKRKRVTKPTARKKPVKKQGTGTSVKSPALPLSSPALPAHAEDAEGFDAPANPKQDDAHAYAPAEEAICESDQENVEDDVDVSNNMLVSALNAANTSMATVQNDGAFSLQQTPESSADIDTTTFQNDQSQFHLNRTDWNTAIDPTYDFQLTARSEYRPGTPHLNGGSFATRMHAPFSPTPRSSQVGQTPSFPSDQTVSTNGVDPLDLLSTPYSHFDTAYTKSYARHPIVEQMYSPATFNGYNGLFEYPKTPRTTRTPLDFQHALHYTSNPNDFDPNRCIVNFPHMSHSDSLETMATDHDNFLDAEGILDHDLTSSTKSDTFGSANEASQADESEEYQPFDIPDLPVDTFDDTHEFDQYVNLG